MLGDDAVGHRESQPMPFSGFLRRDERVEDFVVILESDPRARIRNLDFRLAFRGIAQLDPKLAAVGHRIGGIEEQVQQHLLEALGISGDGAYVRQLEPWFDAPPIELLPQKRHGVLDQRPKLDRQPA